MRILLAAGLLCSAFIPDAHAASVVTVEVMGDAGAKAYLFQNGKPTPITQYPKGTRLKASSEPKGPWRTILLPSPVGSARSAWVVDREVTVVEGASSPSSSARSERSSGGSSGTKRAFHIGALAGMEMLNPTQLETSIGLSQVANFTVLPFGEIWYGGGSSPFGFGLRGGYFTVTGRATDTTGAVYEYTASGIPVMLTVDFRAVQGQSVDFSLGVGGGLLIGAKATATDSVQTFSASFLAPMGNGRAQVILKIGRPNFLSLLIEGGYQMVLPLGSPTLNGVVLKNDLSGIVGMLGARFRL